MTKERLVVALGGNALGKTPEEQLELVKITAKTIVDLSEKYDVIIGHGNGPQVGMINNALSFSAKNGGNTPAMPFAECGAMSQGYIGYHLMQAIQNELQERKLEKPVTCLVTQVVVDKDDPGFKNPTKPIGSFMTKEEAEEAEKATGDTYVEDAGRGYRRVVASPMPQEIIGLDTIETLVQAGTIVITVGGGGIPVVKAEDGKLSGVAAVIDKDRSSSRLALDVKADRLVILTAVDQVAIRFNKPDQKNLSSINTEEAKKYIEDGEFAPGSMLPKIEACLDFVENSDKGTALITSLQKAKEALEGKTGTVIER